MNESKALLNSYRFELGGGVAPAEVTKSKEYHRQGIACIRKERLSIPFFLGVGKTKKRFTELIK